MTFLFSINRLVLEITSYDEVSFF